MTRKVVILIVKFTEVRDESFNEIVMNVVRGRTNSIKYKQDKTKQKRATALKDLVAKLRGVTGP